MLHHYFPHDRRVSCDWVSGAYMFFRSEIIEQLPDKKLAEDFFMYCEDVLWCWQIKELGYEIEFIPEPQVFHIHHGSVNKEKKIRVRETVMKNHSLFMKNYFYPNWKYYVFRSIYFCKQHLIMLIEQFKK